MNFEVFSVEQFDEESTYNGISKLPVFRYEDIKEIVCKIIEKNNIKRIPIDVFELARKLGMRVVKYSLLTEKEMSLLEEYGISRDSDGFYALAKKHGKNIPYIYYNDKKDAGRIRFTILHEIGHFVLDHLQQSDLAEAEANFFAKYLIAPPVLVDKIKPCDYMDIACVFKVSISCAWNAFDYYEKWKKHYISCGGRYTEYEKKILRNCFLELPENYRGIA